MIYARALTGPWRAGLYATQKSEGARPRAAPPRLGPARPGGAQQRRRRQRPLCRNLPAARPWRACLPPRRPPQPCRPQLCSSSAPPPLLGADVAAQIDYITFEPLNKEAEGIGGEEQGAGG